MKSTNENSCVNLWSLCRGWLKSPVTHILVLALLVASLPMPARATWQQKSLPGNGLTPLEIGAIAAVGASLAIYLIARKMGRPSAKLDVKPVHFTNFVPGQPMKLTVAVKNSVSVPITVNELTVDDHSGALTLGEARQTPFTLAPSETYEIPVTLSTNNNAGSGRIRIVERSQKAKKDRVMFVKVSYGKKK
jgi:uncharacterized membrane protein